METISIKKTDAIIAYKNASKDGKKALADLLGKNNLPVVNIDEIKTFDDILKISGKTMADMEKPGDTIDEIAYRKAKLIALVYNDGVEMDPFNTDQIKYYPWHKIAGFGLSYVGYDRWGTAADVGSRLCFDTAEKAIDAGKKFIDIYTDLKIK